MKIKIFVVSCLIITSTIIFFPLKISAAGVQAAGCISIVNLNEFTNYRFLLPMGGWYKLDDDVNAYGQEFFEFTNKCVLLGVTMPGDGDKIYAVKNNDFNKYFRLETSELIDGPFYSALFLDNGSVSSTLPADVYRSNYLKTDDSLVTDPNIIRVDQEFKIVNINTTLNLEMIKKTNVYRDGTQKIVFQNSTSQAPSQPITSAKPKSNPKPASQPTPAPIKPTLTATLAKTTAQNKTVTLTSNSTALRTTDTLTLSGTTSPNAKVTLTIQSNPITVDLTADQDGKWTYTLNPKTLKLALGSHTVTAVATSSEGIKSDPITLATFTLKSPPVIQKEVPAKMSFPTSFYILLSLTVALIIILVIVMTRSRFTNRKKEDEL